MSQPTVPNSQVRVRFAPSPTGFLHVGGARTALFNYFFAKKHGGVFVLRIEDTDTERNRPEFEKEILESMRWLGMNWDEGPHYQTQRFDRYRDFAQQLLKQGKAYRCYCSEAEVQAMREKATAEGRKPMYDRRCRELTATRDLPFVLRFKTPLEGEVVIDDLVKGEVRVNLHEVDDFIILRSNDTPTYNFTVVVDDVEMKISHVIRAEEHLNNTPKQLLVIEALGAPAPRYAHVPLVLAPDKTKLSKRHGAVAVTEFRREGYLVEAMVNYLVRLGWSHGDDEIFSQAQLGQLFDLDGVGASGSVFDRAKLDWYNAHYIKTKSPAELVALILETSGHDYASLLAAPAGEKLFLALRERAVRLTDFTAQLKWYLSDTVDFDAASVETVLRPAKPEALAALRKALAALPPDEFRAERIAPLFKETALKLGLKMPDVAKPARVLLTGSLASPDIGLVVEALGRERTLARLAAKV